MPLEALSANARLMVPVGAMDSRCELRRPWARILSLMSLEMIVPAIGALTAVLGIAITRIRGEESGLTAINRGFYTSAAAGANIHWDATNAKTTISATSNLKIGVAAVTSTNTATTVRVRLNGSF